MSDQAWSKEPWRFSRPGDPDKVGFIIFDQYRMLGKTLWRKESESNAARIVQCVNALAGIEDPAALLSEVKILLDVAVCPSKVDGCDGQGIPHQIGEDEWEQEQCQWCHERRELLTTIARAEALK